MNIAIFFAGLSVKLVDFAASSAALAGKSVVIGP